VLNRDAIGRVLGILRDVRVARSYLVFSIFLLAVSLPRLFAKSTAQVAGVVSDPPGGLVSNASVILFSAEKVREVRTDHFGQFAFVDLPQGIYELQVTHAGFKTVSLGSISATDKLVPQLSISLQLESTGCGDFQPTASYPGRSGKTNLTGTVKDYSAGFVKNATLTLLGSSREQTVKTNGNGEFQFTDLAPGKYTLKVTHKDYFERSLTEFWIARNNLTTLTPTYVFRKDDHTIIVCQ
jgi:hypothetical protein